MGTRPYLSFCACKTARIALELLVSMVPRPHLWILSAKQRLLEQRTSHYGYQTLSVVLCMQNSAMSTRITSLYGFQPSFVVFELRNSNFWNRITNLYGSQRSPVVLCMQYSMIRTRVTCLYRSQPLSVVFACKTATFGEEYQVSTGPRYNLSFCACKTA